MKSQSLAVLSSKRERTHAPNPSFSGELQQPSFSRQNRNRSIDTFKEFESSLLKLQADSKSSSLHKPKNEEIFKPSPSVLKSKQLRAIDDRLKQKLFIDGQLDQAYGKQIGDYQNKKSILEKRLMDIRVRNNLRIKEIQEFQDNIMAKYKAEFNRDKQEYGKLSEMYTKLKNEEELVEQKYNAKKQKASQDKERIQQEQRRFINFINNLKNQNANLMKNADETMTYNSKSQKEETVKQPISAKRSISTKVKVDSKEIGDQYLEENKRMSLKNKRRQPTPVNLKSIDYNPQVKQRLEKNEKTLSEIPLKSQELKPKKRIFTVSQGIQNQTFTISSSNDRESNC